MGQVGSPVLVTWVVCGLLSLHLLPPGVRINELVTDISNYGFGIFSILLAKSQIW